MAAIDAVGFERLQNMAGVLIRAARRIDRLGSAVEDLLEFRLEPVARLGGVTQIAARLAMDPVRHIDPLVDLVGTLAIPG